MTTTIDSWCLEALVLTLKFTVPLLGTAVVGYELLRRGGAFSVVEPSGGGFYSGGTQENTNGLYFKQ